MWRLALIVYLFLIPRAFAFDINDVAMDHGRISGSTIVKYGGIQGRIHTSLTRRLEKDWRDGQRLQLKYGAISILEFNRRQRHISWEINDSEAGGKWWHRPWHLSLSPTRGGAPEFPRIIRIGHTYTVCDLGLLSITNAFSIEWREFKKEFDVKAILGEERKKPSGTSWVVRLKPKATFSLSGFRDRPINFIKEFGATVTLVHKIDRVPIVRIKIDCEYDVHREEFKATWQLQLLQW